MVWGRWNRKAAASNICVDNSGRAPRSRSSALPSCFCTLRVALAVSLIFLNFFGGGEGVRAGLGERRALSRVWGLCVCVCEDNGSQGSLLEVGSSCHHPVT